jgi:UDP-N-acetylglucosamine 3-dehydrogenase
MAEVIALADRNEEKLNRAGDQYQVQERHVDYMGLLRNPEVEAVCICLPLRFHFEAAMASLDAGKHVLLEKPLAMNLGEADRLIGRANKTDRKIMLGLNKRWHPLVRGAREMIRNGMLGPVRLLSSVNSCGNLYKKVPDWRLQREAGGGSIIEIGTHFVDMWYFLIEDEIEEVSTFSGSIRDIDDEPAGLMARTKNGVLLNFALSDILPVRNEIEILGETNGLRISLNRFDGYEFTPIGTNAGSIRNRMRNLAHFFQRLPRGIVDLGYGGHYRASFVYEWKHFIHCIQHDKPVSCTLEDGRRALRVILAAIRSSSLGRRVKIAEVMSG